MGGKNWVKKLACFLSISFLVISFGCKMPWDKSTESSPINGGGSDTKPINEVINLQLLVSPSDSAGVVNLSPEGKKYNKGTEVSLTPVPNSGYKFKEWGGTNGSEVINNKIIMNSDKSITAVMTLEVTNLQLLISPSDSAGVVNLSPEGQKYNKGTEVSLTPVSNSGYKFKEWGGTNGIEVINNKITMNSDKRITAVFLAPPPPPVGLGKGSGSLVAWYNYSNGFLVGISVYISWKPSPTATGYKVYLKYSSSDNYSLNKTTTWSTSETIDVSSFAKGSTVYFVVTATNEAGESGYSNVYNVKL